MLKKALMPLIITLVGSSLIAVLVIAKPKPSSNPPPDAPARLQVAVVEAKRGASRIAVVTQGTVYPKREIDLVAQVSGQIVEVGDVFSSGGFFQPEQQLLRIDPRDYEVALLNAKARKADAERRLAEERGLARQAKREWRDLGNQQSNDLFMRKPQLAAAQASLAFAEGDLARAQLDLERTVISAPFKGRIKEVYANLGQFVSPGAKIGKVYDSSVLEVKIPLTENQASLIELPLFNQNEAAPQVTVHGVVAGYRHTWHGKLVRADAFIDLSTRMYHALVEVEQDDPAAGDVPLLPGLFVDVQIEGRELAGVIELPRTALFQRNRLITVEADQRAKVHEVKVLHKTSDRIWVASDIADGALISIEKQGLLTDGTEVEAIRAQVEAEQLSTLTSTEAGEL